MVPHIYFLYTFLLHISILKLMKEKIIMETNKTL